MKSVVERCTQLQGQLTRLRQTQKNQEKAKSIGVRREELESRRVKLTRLTAAATVLLRHEQLAPKLFPGVDKAQQSCTAVQQLLNTDPESLTRGRDYSNLLRRLDQISESLEHQTKAVWSEFVKKHEGGDERFLTQVEQVPGQAKAVNAIRVARKAVIDATAQVPVNEEQYQHFLSCSRALQQALGKLDPHDFPADVLGFFKRAQSPGGAPLAMFTEEVQVWLKRKGMLEGLRIRFDGEG